MIRGLSLSVACLAFACSFGWPNLAKTDSLLQTGLSVKTKRADDTVAIQRDGGKTAVLIRSPYGISQAVIERSGEEWPASIVLKLQLKGLSHLRLANGKTILEAAVSAQDEKLSVRVWKDQAEDSPLDPSSRYWIKVRLLGHDGKPVKTIPLKDGVFELILPEAFFKDNPKSITVDWIDFYRG